MEVMIEQILYPENLLSYVNISNQESLNSSMEKNCYHVDIGIISISLLQEKAD